MEYKDYYKMLEIDKKATPDEIKRAYRKLAKKYHPDTNNDKDAEAKFKDATEAYEVLSDANKKAKYDNLGNSYNRFKTTGGNPNDFKWNDWYTTYKTDNKVNSKNTASDFFNQGGSVSDFFERIFGNTTAKNTGNNKNKSKTTTNNNNKSKQTTQTKGKNYQTEITLSMEEVYKGTKRVFNIDNQRIEVKFKQGITDGHTQKISGKGYPSQNGGKAGDLIIKVKIAEDIKVERKKNDIYTNVECDLYTAMLGGNVTFTTFFGSFNIKIPAETQNGKTFKLSNQGMPVYNSNDNEKGDLYVHLQVVLPTNLNPEEKQMFEKLKSIRN